MRPKIQVQHSATSNNILEILMRRTLRKIFDHNCSLINSRVEMSFGRNMARAVLFNIRLERVAVVAEARLTPPLSIVGPPNDGARSGAGFPVVMGDFHSKGWGRSGNSNWVAVRALEHWSASCFVNVFIIRIVSWWLSVRISMDQDL